MIKVGIVRNSRSFLPEIEAYVKAFQSIPSFDISVVDEKALERKDFDVTLLFCGFYPFWMRLPGIVIVEYHSLSTGRWRKLKDVVKRIVNIRGDHYIFLNDKVRRGLLFNSRVPQSIRGMGYSSELARKFSRRQKRFDFVYCGSIRNGVIGAIKKISSFGFSVAVVGAVGKSHQLLADDLSGMVHSIGQVSLETAYEVMAQSVYGLNYTPDERPFNIQDSTKVIEYLGLGLKVVSNKYQWMSEFEAASGARILDVDSINAREDVERFQYSAGQIERWEWSEVISRSGIVESVVRLVEKKGRK